MRPILLTLLLLLTFSCHRDAGPNAQLYGKWILTGGSALVKRQSSAIMQPIYFTFTQHGSIESNWSNCYSYRFGAANELMVNNNCIDCIIDNCGQSVWHYRFDAGNELRIEFQPGDIGLLRRE